MKKNVYSFDVFDTCLVRLCGEPQNLFEVLSMKVIQLMNLPSEDQEHMRQLFVAARMECGGDLTHVYRTVDRIFPLPCSVEKMVDLELVTEKQMLFPIIKTRNLINELRTKGKIIFVSDMYLPTDFIRDNLYINGFYKEGDKLFVSDSLGAWKRDGSLYRLIHKEENISYYHWHHYGDNIKSDVRIPRRLGIHTHHLHYDYLPYEKTWIKCPTIHFQYPSIVAGISRALRLSSSSPESLNNFVCDISAPLMITWVIRIMTDANKRGIKRMYFLARDAHSDYLIAKQLQPLFPKLEARYLFISRQSRDEDQEILLQYLQQEGLASTTDYCAIVDISSTGTSHAIINELLISHEYNPCTSYLYQQGNIYTIPKDKNIGINSEIMSFYTNKIPIPILNKATNRILPELVFPLNFHLRTVGYCKRGNVFRPVFKKDSIDNIEVENFKKLKKANDNLLVDYTQAIKATGCLMYADLIFERIAMPTFCLFTFSPRKPYVEYLRQFFYNKKPFVNLLFPSTIAKHNYIWLRGSIALSLPYCIGNTLYYILQSRIMKKVVKIAKKVK